MAKRDWATAWPIFQREIVGPWAGISAAGATVAGVSGGLVAIGIAAPVLVPIVVAGSIIAVTGLAAVGLRSIPRRSPSVDDLRAQEIPVEQLTELHPRVVSIGIVGDSRAGKTTLIKRIMHLPAPSERTVGVTAHLVALQTSPPQHIAIIDGGGEEFVDQFKVTKYADILLVILDHNASDSDATIDHVRLDYGTTFQRQIRSYLKTERGGAPKPDVYIIGNKRDLWEGESGRDHFVSYLNEGLASWQASNLANKATLLIHSNFEQDDIANLVKLVASYVER
jgi:hypothetical protein